jgi:hypothetical protein
MVFLASPKCVSSSHFDHPEQPLDQQEADGIGPTIFAVQVMQRPLPQ